jgi:hypothetical protein
VTSLRLSALAVALVALVAAGGCATGKKEPTDADVQRAAEGPTADKLFMGRFLRGYGRLPTFEESAAFRIDVEERVSDYLAKHPDLSTSPRASQFTFQRRINIGMNKEEVLLLAGVPYETTEDQKKMEEGARQFWPTVKVRAKEMWVYPDGWKFYFADDQLVDLTVFGASPL